MGTISKTNQIVRESVLARIEAEHLEPKPAWHFLLKEWVVWGVAGVSLLLGSIATALTLYLMQASFFMEQQIEHSPLDHLFELVPLFWILLAALAIFYTIHAIRDTKRGYRYGRSWLVGGAFALSIVLGSIAHAAGLGLVIDNYLIENVPAYRPLTGYQVRHFMAPGQGIHAGVLIDRTDSTVRIRNLEREEIEFTLTDESGVRGFMRLEPGMPVRIVSTTSREQGEERLEIIEMGPFQGRGSGAGMMRGGGGFRTLKENGMGMRSTK